MSVGITIIQAYGRKNSESLEGKPLHRGAFCQFTFRWIHYYDGNKSTGLEFGKLNLCALSEGLLCSTQSPKGSCGVRERTAKFQKGLKISTKTKPLIIGFPNIFDNV